MVALTPQPKPDFETFISGLENWLWELAHRLAHAYAIEPEDARQELLLLLLATYSKWTPERGNAVTWATLKYCFLRSKWKVKKNARKREDEPTSFLPLHREIVDQRATDPQAVVELGEDVERLRAALPRLRERERSVIEGRFWEGLSLRDAGQRIGGNQGVANAVQRAAIGKLRGMLAAG